MEGLQSVEDNGFGAYNRHTAEGYLPCLRRALIQRQGSRDRNLYLLERLSSAQEGRGGFDSDGQEGHGMAAEWTKHWWFFSALLWRLGNDMEQELQQLNQAFGIAMEEAKIAYPSKTLGQHMAEQDPEQLTTGNGLEDGVALVVLGAKGHLSIALRENVLLW